MAFYTSQRGSGAPNVAQAFQSADQAAIQVKKAATVARDKALSGTLTASDILDSLIGILVDSKAKLLTAAAVPGIAEYAAAQFDVPGYEALIGSQFQAMINEITATIAFFVQGYPKDADGNLKKHSFKPDGSGEFVVYAGFSSPQRTATAQRLNALLATID
jgi:hypothetical protein